MLKRYTNYLIELKKSEFIRNLLILLTGNSIAQILSILISPILTRQYSPSDFAVFGLYSSLLIIFTVIASARYEMAIMLPKSDEDSVNLLGISIFFSFVIFILLSLIIIPFTTRWTRLLNNTDIGSWLIFLPLSVFLMGVFRSFNNWNNRLKKYKLISSTLITRNIVMNVSNLGFGFLGFRHSGLIISSILAQTVETSYLILNFLRQNAIKYISLKIIFKKWIYLIKKYKNFPLVSTWSLLVNIISQQIPVFMLMKYFGSDFVGWFYHAYRLLSLPITLIGNSIGQVFFQKGAELLNDSGSLTDIIEKLYQKLILIAVIPLGIVLTFGDYVFGYVFGSEWINSGYIAMILAPDILIRFAIYPLLFVFDLLQKQRVFFVYNSLLLVLRLISFYVGFKIFNDGYIALILYSLTGVLTYSLMSFEIMKLGKVKFSTIYLFSLKIVVPAWTILIIMRIILNIFI